MKFHVAVFEFQSTINNGSAKRSPCRGEFLTISLWLTIYIYILFRYYGEEVKSLDSWMDEDDANKVGRKTEGGRKKRRTLRK